MYRPSRFTAGLVLALQLCSLDLYATGGKVTAQRSQQQQRAATNNSSWLPTLKPWQLLLGMVAVLATTAAGERGEARRGLPLHYGMNRGDSAELPPTRLDHLAQRLVGLEKGDEEEGRDREKDKDGRRDRWRDRGHLEIDLTNGLVGYWPLNGTTEDYSGYDNHGIVIDDGIKVPLSPESVLDPRKQSWTISAWFNKNSPGLMIQRCRGGGKEICKQDRGTQYLLGFFQHGSDFFVGWRIIGSKDPSLTLDVNPVVPTILNVSWHQVTGVFDKKNDAFQVFFDGKILVDKWIYALDPGYEGGSVNFVTNPPLRFLAAEAFRGPFSNLLREIRIYNRALSPPEVRALSRFPIKELTTDPTRTPTAFPTKLPTSMSTTNNPTQSPTALFTLAPTKKPIQSPTTFPTELPTKKQTQSTTVFSTLAPTKNTAQQSTELFALVPTKKTMQPSPALFALVPTKNTMQPSMESSTELPTSKSTFISTFISTTNNPTQSPTLNGVPLVARQLETQYATTGERFEFLVPKDTFTDPDDDTLTLTATLSDGSSLPEWLQFNFDTAEFEGVPTHKNMGTLSIKLTADDGKGGQASELFTIVVQPMHVFLSTQQAEQQGSSSNGNKTLTEGLLVGIGSAVIITFVCVGAKYCLDRSGSEPEPASNRSSYGALDEASSPLLLQHRAGTTHPEVSLASGEEDD